VTVLDNSAEQLARDRQVAERESLDLRIEKGVMEDLSRFDDQAFDLIVHPCSNCFVPDVTPVWRECFRVLRPGGRLLAGFFNPVFYLLDRAEDENGRIEVRHAIPYSDLTSLDQAERARLIDANLKVPHLEFGHSLQDQIGGQLAAGFHLIAFADSRWIDAATTLNRFIAVYALTCAWRPEH
jgi:SAM-dependent methyltransferase